MKTLSRAVNFANDCGVESVVLLGALRFGEDPVKSGSDHGCAVEGDGTIRGGSYRRESSLP